MLRYPFPDERTGSQVPRSALSQIVTRHVHLGTTCLCMWFYYTVRSVHCAPEAMGSGTPALALLVKQGPTADAVLWPESIGRWPCTVCTAGVRRPAQISNLRISFKNKHHGRADVRGQCFSFLYTAGLPQVCQQHKCESPNAKTLGRFRDAFSLLYTPSKAAGWVEEHS